MMPALPSQKKKKEFTLEEHSSDFLPLESTDICHVLPVLWLSLVQEPAQPHIPGILAYPSKLHF